MATKYIINNVSGQTIDGNLTINGDVVITGTTNTRPYKVYTALLNQSGGDNPQFITSGAVTSGVTYYIDNSGISSDFSNVGGPPIGNGGVFFVATNSDVPNNWDGASLQYNTGAPVVTVLENTIGNVWWTYSDVGYYLINFSETFFIEKMYAQGNSNCADGTGFKVTTILAPQPTFNYLGISTTYPLVESISDDLLQNTPIEIRIYN